MRKLALINFAAALIGCSEPTKSPTSVGANSLAHPVVVVSAGAAAARKIAGVTTSPGQVCRAIFSALRWPLTSKTARIEANMARST